MWLRQHDGAAELPVLLAMARNQRDAVYLLGCHTALLLYCAQQPTNGFMPELIVRRYLPARVRDGFLEAGLLHPAGHVCECQKGRPWPAGAAYSLHHYLEWNPLKEEYDVKVAKEAELKDRALTEAVRGRDRDLCRYCGIEANFFDRRGGSGLVFDHVDPKVANGAANLVVACRSCNSRKGNRTPEAAGMRLMPPPPPDDATEGAPDLQLADPIASDLDTGWSAHSVIAPGDNVPAKSDPDGSAPTSRPINGATYPDTNPDPDRIPALVEVGSEAGPTTPRAGLDGTGRDGTGRVEAGWAGPDGERERVGPPPDRHSSTRPNPYLRRAVTGPDPAHHAGLPRGPPHRQGHSAPTTTPHVPERARPMTREPLSYTNLDHVVLARDIGTCRLKTVVTDAGRPVFALSMRGSCSCGTHEQEFTAMLTTESAVGVIAQLSHCLGQAGVTDAELAELSAAEFAFLAGDDGADTGGIVPGCARCGRAEPECICAPERRDGHAWAVR